ncbi:hypothetical protein [Microbacterium rhizomatis]|uniref:Uncharacterized protein n=1 Tax=Microbacterium rhizomatis TaxID=1631477 RepID=A0A5J5J2R8_9MICO|nr:hypothetical protein [Microbacterium rhizomatis]KAA9110371.1 hypothetical protein F6B43_01365 [Microbacterium rhizomatis]
MIPFADSCSTPLICAIDGVANALDVDPLPGFFLTLTATFLGAVTGAFVVWLLSRGRQKQDREDRKEERKQDRLDREAEREQARIDRSSELTSERMLRQIEREQDRGFRAHERFDVAVAAVIERIGAAQAATLLYRHELSAGGAALPPHGAQAQMHSAIRIAQMTATHPDDVKPLDATFAVVTARNERTSQQTALNYQNAADTLAEWRRGLLTADQAAEKIRHRPAPRPPADDEADDLSR